MGQRKYIKVIMGMLLPLTIFAQTELWKYQDRLGEAYSIVYGADGNIYAAGVTATGFGAFIVISLTNRGDERWVYVYYGPDDGPDAARTIVYGSDGNIYAAGLSASSNSRALTVVSLTSSGTERWVYRYTGPQNGYNAAHSIVYGADSNIYVGGESEDDFLVLSLTNLGSERWVYKYNGTANGFDHAYSIVYGADNNIYAAGDVENSVSYDDVIVVSLTNSGEERWVRIYDGPANFYDQARSIVYGADGNLYVGGTQHTTGGYPDLLVLSLTRSSIIRWVYVYNSPTDSSDLAYSIVYGLDENIYVGGTSQNNSSFDFTIISLTNSGTERWVYRYNGPAGDPDVAYQIVYGADGNLYGTGYTSIGVGTFGDLVALSVTNSGVERWVYLYNGAGNWADFGNSICYGADNNVYVAGSAYEVDTFNHFTVICLSSGGEVSEDTRTPIPRVLFVSSFFKDKITLKFSESYHNSIKIFLYNIYGNLVFENSLPYALCSITIDDEKIKSLPEGIYFLSVASGKKELGKVKLIKLE